MRPVSLRTEDIERMRLCLGFVGENEHTRITFDATKEFGQYPNAAASLTVCPQDAEPYPAIIARDGNFIIWDITDSDLVHDGDGEYQLSFTQEPHVAKTYIGKMWVKRSLVPSGDIPEGIDDFLTRAGAALTAIPETIFAALAEAKESGEFDGVGIKRIAKTATAGLVDTYTITLTDDRTYTYTVTNGAKGDPGDPGDDGNGIQRIEKTGTSGLVDTYTITYTNGTTTTFTVTNGAKGDPGDDYVLTQQDKEAIAEIVEEDVHLDELEEDVEALKNAINDKADEPTGTKADGKIYGLALIDGVLKPVWITPAGGSVSDVQIAGTSILNQGVANVPLATNKVFGVVKTNTTYGTLMNNGEIRMSGATTEEIKAASTYYKPIAPGYLNYAVFYGMAKAAGDSTQSASSNAVGTYTETAKSAISQMLNAPETVSGTTPSITAKPGIPYRCGECATLDIIAPASGCIDVVFTSGSTPTVLTVTSAKVNTTIKWLNGFDPTSLEANTTYEINILDGEFGVVGSWT